MKLLPKIFLAVLIGFLFAVGFTFIFLNLLNRPTVEQVLLLFFAMTASGYLMYSYLEIPKLHSGRLNKIHFGTINFISFFREHLAGTLLALVFFLVYFYVGLKLNPANIDTVDNFMDADNSSWMRRIADVEGSGIEMRGPHPFAYLIFRPFGFIFNIATHNFALSAILLNTLAGAICVFLTWFYFKRHTQNSAYAILIASFLGLSTSQFFFSSVVETYIFSSLFLITFFVLLQKNEEPIGGLVFVSLITFGITLTNFVQTFIGFFISRPRIRDAIRFAGLTLSFGVLLSLIHAAWYPSSKLFFLPSDAQAEGEFSFSIFNEPFWKGFGRVILLVRTILLYTVVAPRPYVFTAEVGGTFPRFNFFKISPEIFSYSSYTGLGDLLIFAWATILLLSGLFFAIDLFRTRKIDVRISFVLCILLNFVLHMYYGYELFLYSPDWAYALMFFVGLSLVPISSSKYFLGGLFIFLIALVINQWQFFQFIFTTIAPFVN